MESKTNPMRYLVTADPIIPFFTDNFDAENHFAPQIGMVVYDLFDNRFMFDGKTWYDIPNDTL